MLIVLQPPSVRLPNIVLKLIFFANVRALCEKKKKRKKISRTPV